MYGYKNTIEIFATSELDDYLASLREGVKQDIHKEPRDSLLNANEVTYVQYLLDKYTIEPLVVEFENMSLTEKEEMIDARFFPRDFYVSQGGRYPKQVITYHVPFSGHSRLLHLRPSQRLMWTTKVVAAGNSFSFDIVNWRDNPQEIKRSADDILESIKIQLKNVNNQVDAYNNYLESDIQRIFTERKGQLLKQSNTLAALGIPLKSNQSVPQTFAVNKIQKRKIIVEKPASSNQPFTPEPTINDNVYEEILMACHSIGVQLERHPSLYENKGEEALRDHFLLVLAPNFDSVTGETFNRKGKTDILVRHEGKNLFVGECKFWRGKKQLHDTIDQILSYLTWRDSKAAILFFVDNKNFGPVLDQIVDETKEHACFVKFNGKRHEGGFDFYFHLSNDETRSVKLAIQLYHYPEVN